VIAEFDVVFHLLTQFGTLLFNQPLDTTSDRRLQLAPTKCNAGLPVRTTDDDIPQGDGKISHRRWRSGYQMHLAFEPVIWDGDPDNEAEPACGADLVEMLDLVGLHVNELIRTGQVAGPGARIYWTPTGASDDRMLDRVQLLNVNPPEVGGGELGGTLIEFDVDSAFPYYIEATETDTMFADGDTQVVNNAGNVDYMPILQVFGAFDGFIIQNHTVQDLDGVDLELYYNSSLPGADAIGGSDYVEIEFFRETAYLNGSSSNEKGGLDFRVSDFFPLVPGDNEIEINFIAGGAATALLKSNGAWA
jgi:hypothetical protein